MQSYTGTVVCVGTGPSLSLAQVETARQKGFTLFGCNLVYRDVPDLRVLFGCNGTFWDYYLQGDERLRQHPCEKWTSDEDAAKKHELNFIRGVERRGLSQDPTKLHHGHSSGYQLLGLAYLMGASRIVLLGYDLRYSSDYSGVNRQPGTTPRHYFGEYPSALQHWPKVSVAAGVHCELVGLYESVAAQGLVEIINCTGPDSALTCFPRTEIVALASDRRTT